jgi:hypothetical protein
VRTPVGNGGPDAAGGEANQGPRLRWNHPDAGHRKGKASKPTEFGKLVQGQETGNQIITHYDVFDQRPSDRDLLLGAVENHERVLGQGHPHKALNNS